MHWKEQLLLSFGKKKLVFPMYFLISTHVVVLILSRVSPSGEDPPTTRKIDLSPPSPCPPTVLTQKCRFCHFHAVFGHFVQIVSPTSRPQLGNPVKGN